MSTSNKKTSETPTPQPGDPLFNLHHAEAEAALEAQNPVAMTQMGLSANDSNARSGDADEFPADRLGPVDSQGQRRGLPTEPETGSTAGHR